MLLFYIYLTWLCTFITSKEYNYILPAIFKALQVSRDKLRN